MKLAGLALSIAACTLSTSALSQQLGWSTQTIPGEVADLGIQTDGLNNAYIAYSLYDGSFPRNVKVIKLDSETNTVSDNLDSQDVISGSNIEIAVDKNDQTVYVFVSKRDDQDNIVGEIWALKQGGSWTLISSNANIAMIDTSYSSAISVAPNGEVYVVYQTSKVGVVDNDFLKVKKYSPKTGTWTDLDSTGLLPLPPEGEQLLIRHLKINFKGNTPYISFVEAASVLSQVVVSHIDLETEKGVTDFEGGELGAVAFPDLLLGDNDDMKLTFIQNSGQYWRPAEYAISDGVYQQLYYGSDHAGYFMSAVQTSDHNTSVITFRDDTNNYKPTLIELSSDGVELGKKVFQYDTVYNVSAMSKDNIIFNAFSTHENSGSLDLVVKYKHIK